MYKKGMTGKETARKLGVSLAKRERRGSRGKRRGRKGERPKRNWCRERMGRRQVCSASIIKEFIIRIT
jgi:hypothetical protein